MTRHLHFITGLVMLVLAATLAFMASRRPPAPDSASTRRSEPNPPGAAPHKRAAAAFPAAPAAAGKSPARDGATGVRAAAASPIMSGDLQVTVDPAHPRHAELLPRAGQVERHARERIASLTRALDLTPAQQRRIFPLLARAADSYDPAMTVLTGGSHAAAHAAAPAGALDGGEGEALLQQELDPAQQDRLIEHSLTDLMLWEEIIGNLMLQLDQPAGDPTVPPASEPAAAEPASPPPASRGGRNLFEAVTPAE
jgi:hypothetical protein